MSVVHVVLPGDIDDAARPSGGNTYDRRICQQLAADGWEVREHAVPGAWPRPDAGTRTAVTVLMAGLADGTVVLLDGLIASAVPDITGFADRLRLVVLVHMIAAQESDVAAEPRATKAAVLASAQAIIATSRWLKLQLIEQYALRPDRIQVIEPGVGPAALARGTDDGGKLLCVAAVTPAKGHDVLVTALAELTSQKWSCTCVGAVDLAAGFVDRLSRVADEAGIADRIRFVGTLGGVDLDAAYAAADVLVVCSRTESYGMVITEALARGVPVIAASVGGVPEALGYGVGATRPGILIPPEDPNALAAALRIWLGEAVLRQSLREAAVQRRETLVPWTAVAARIGHMLTRVRG